MMSCLPTRYTTPAIVLHWLLALLIVTALSLGVAMVGLPLSPLKLRLYNLHKWLGIVILAGSALRLLWRLTHRPPALPPMPAWQSLFAHGAHRTLYLLFFAVPLVGWAYSSAVGFPVVLFGLLPLPDLVMPDRELAAAIKPWHGRLAYALATLASLHAGAALKHQFVDRDGLLQRMLPAWLSAMPGGPRK